MPKKDKSLGTILQSSVKNTRQFNYQKGTMVLNFTVDIDNSTELMDFRELLVRATEDISGVLGQKLKVEFKLNEEKK